MPDIALRPRSATELVDAAFQLYRRDPIPFIAGMALINLPWFVIMIATHMTDWMTVNRAVGPDGGIAAEYMTPVLYMGIGSVVVQALGMYITTVLANESYFGRTLSLGHAARQAFFRAYIIVVAALMIALPLMVGFMLLFIPALYLLGRWFAMPAAVALEDAGPIGGLARSWTLSKGHVRHVINTMGLVILLQIAIAYGANFLALLIPGQTVKLLLGVLVSCVSQPMMGIVATLLYYDIRIRREGFDIEYLAAASRTDEPSAVP